MDAMQNAKVAFVLAALAACVTPMLPRDAAAAPPPPGATHLPGDQRTPDKRTPEQRNTDFVRHVFHDLLGRAPDAQELGVYQHALTTGTSREAIALLLLGSNELHDRFVKQTAAALLPGVTIASGYLGTLLARLNAGDTMERSVIVPLVESNHYPPKMRAGDASFVTAVYRDLLGRVPTANELSSDVASLQSGGGRRPIAMRITASPEYREKLLASFFTTFLGRAIDAASQQSFLAMFANGARREQVMAAILGSAEYYARR